MNFAEISECIKSRRSIRKFSDLPISREDVLDIIDIAVHAPSNNNRQGWKFYVLSGKSKIHQVASEVEKALEKCAGISEVIDEVMKGYSNHFTVFRNAPMVLVCCFVKPAGFNFRIFETDEENLHFTGELISVSMAMQNILLLAEARGIGTLVMTAPLIGAKGIKEILGIPRKYTIASFICLGHYDSGPESPGRKSGADVTVFIE